MLKILGIVTLVLVVLFVGIAFLLPREVQVERSTTIERPPAMVFEVLNGFIRFNEWSPWVAKDPDATYAREGPETGAGATLRFEGNPSALGAGFHRIRVSAAHRQITMEHELGPHMGLSKFLLSPAPDRDGTSLVWSFAIDLGMNPISRWRGLSLEAPLGRDCEAGLASLKALVEKLPRAGSSSPPANAR